MNAVQNLSEYEASHPHDFYTAYQYALGRYETELYGGIGHDSSFIESLYLEQPAKFIAALLEDDLLSEDTRETCILLIYELAKKHGGAYYNEIIPVVGECYYYRLPYYDVKSGAQEVIARKAIALLEEIPVNNPRYNEAVFMIACMRERFDGKPALEFIDECHASTGTTSSVDKCLNDALLDFANAQVNTLKTFSMFNQAKKPGLLEQLNQDEIGLSYASSSVRF
jgi:hypothetical protein